MFFRPEHTRLKPAHANTSHLDSFQDMLADQQEVTLFSSDALRWLTKNGYFILTLNGMSIDELIQRGLVFNSSFSSILDQITHLRSRKTHVALKTSTLFLEGTLGKRMWEQDIVISGLDKRMHQDTDLTARLGSVADYAEIIFQMQQDYTRSLFGSKQAFAYTRTTTMLEGGMHLVIGNNSPGYGLCVESRELHLPFDNVGLAPLFAPSKPGYQLSF